MHTNYYVHAYLYIQTTFIAHLFFYGSFQTFERPQQFEDYVKSQGYVCVNFHIHMHTFREVEGGAGIQGVVCELHEKLRACQNGRRGMYLYQYCMYTLQCIYTRHVHHRIHIRIRLCIYAHFSIIICFYGSSGDALSTAASSSLQRICCPCFKTR